jgi:hypothetical protein
MNKFAEKINGVAAGNSNGEVLIYWDDQNADDAGAAYRTTAGESGPLHFEGWSSADANGYELAHYFDSQGEYKGPDADGVYPIFSA